MMLHIFLQAFASALLFFSFQCLANSDLVWEKSKGAVSYEYQVSSDETFKNILAESKTNSPAADVSELPPGNYFIRVRFYDKWKRVSKYSDHTQFIINQIIPPPPPPVVEIKENTGPKIKLTLSSSTRKMNYLGSSFKDQSQPGLKLERDLLLSGYDLNLALGVNPSSKNYGNIYLLSISAGKPISNSNFHFDGQIKAINSNLVLKDSAHKYFVKGINSYLGPSLSYRHEILKIALDYGYSLYSKNDYLSIQGEAVFYKKKNLTISGGLRYDRVEIEKNLTLISWGPIISFLGTL